MFLSLKRPSFSSRSSKKIDRETHSADEIALPNGDDSRRKKDKKKKHGRVSRNGSDSYNTDTVRGRLRLLILGRPPLQTLQEKGIIKENVFGCPLEKLCAKENSMIPNFVKLCVEEVDKRGLDVDGIYRVSGSMSSIMKLRYMIDREEKVDLSSPEWSEIHLVAGALKMFLRELPEPVLPFRYFNEFISSCQIRNYTDRVNSIKSLVKSLPPVNLNTLQYLIEHFTRVISHKATNRMETQNIAIVFGPTLLLKPLEESHLVAPGSGEMAVTMHFQNLLVETIVSECSYIFG